MSESTNKNTTGELVPLADRLRYMLGFRALVAVGVGLSVLLAGDDAYVPAAAVGAATGAFLALAVLSHFAWKVSRRGGTAVFGGMLMVDGIYLAWTAYATGGAVSPVRYLIVLELLTVALLASHRTGMKLATWHSLLLLVIYHAQKSGQLEPFADNGIGTPFQQLIAFTAIFWFVALATASFSAVNERELRRRRYDLEALATMATRLEQESDPRAVAAALLESIADTFDFRRAVLLGAREGEALELLARHGTVDAKAGSTRPAPGSVLELASGTRRTHLFSRLDAAADPWLDAMLPDAHSLLVVPLVAEGRTIGVLVAEHEARAGSRIERRLVDMVERFASHGALALHGAWLLEEVRKLAATDGLTGVANRATFEDALARELSRAARARTDVSLVMCDIDHFKRLNDTYGHQTGDDVLKRVAAGLADGCRAYDTAARYGGEEFALILPGASHEDAFALADRLRREAAEHGAEPRVTMSAGVATFPLDATDGESLIKAADGALYASKDGGRDRVSSCRTQPSRSIA